jgi:hypothetical protein
VQFSYLPTLRALAALARTEAVKALDVLKPAERYDLATPAIAFNWFFAGRYPGYVRGLALLALGRPNEAAAEFQKILDHRGLLLGDPMGALARLQLARALAVGGDRDKAKAEYEALLELWKDADADLPVLEQARREYQRLK